MSHLHHYQSFLANNPNKREMKEYEFLSAETPLYLNYQGKTLINFSSNDYLGLSHHPLVIKRAKEYLKKYGAGGTASRLVTGNKTYYSELEKQLAALLGKPAALIFPTGFQANSSIIPALLDATVLGSEPLVFCDQLCHASMLIGMQGVRLKRFRHNDLSHLRVLLEKYVQPNAPCFIFAESLYSMEGDQADLAGLIALSKAYQALLYVDDAHGVGIGGVSGCGYTTDFSADIDVIMGTFSKGLGSLGAYIGCSLEIRDYLINKCKGLIYSTALPPAVLGAISAAIELIPHLKTEREQVAFYAQKVSSFLRAHGLASGNSTTAIVPWIIGDADKTLRASQLLLEAGILGVPIRPPSVLPGQSRIRFCLSAAHTQADVEHLLRAIQTVEEQL